MKKDREWEWSTHGGPLVTPQVAGGISQLEFRTCPLKPRTAGGYRFGGRAGASHLHVRVCTGR